MKKIILLEPNENHRNVFGNILRKKSLLVFALKNYIGTKMSLVNCPLNNLPDMLIIGYGIPFEYSLDLIEFIREKYADSNIKIFKLCPNKTPEMCHKLIEAGANDYMSLSEFTPESFISKIASLFHRDAIPWNRPSEAVSRPENISSLPIELRNQLNALPIEIETKKPESIIHPTIKKVNWKSVKSILTLSTLERKIKKAFSAKAIPYVITELIRLTSLLETEIKDLIHFIELDPGLTVRVLRCANSAYYRGNKSKIYNLFEAVKTMGFYGLRDLVMTIGIIDTFLKTSHSDGLDRMKLWYHSLAVGITAKEIARLANHQNPDHFFLAGILHDIGTSLFDEYFSNEYKEVLSFVKENHTPIATTERKMLGIDHCELGYRILRQWGFTEDILNLLINHHSSFEEILRLNNINKEDIVIVKLADCLSNCIGAGLFDHEEFEEIPNTVFSFLNLDVTAVNEMLLKINDNVVELIQVMLLNIDSSNFETYNYFNSKKLTKSRKIVIFSNQLESYINYEVLFKKLNYKVTINKNLLSLSDNNDYDYILLDLSNENEVLQYIATLKRLTHKQKEATRIMIMTTESIYNTIQANNDFNDKLIYLIKPVSITTLFTAIDEMVSNETPQETNQKPVHTLTKIQKDQIRVSRN